MGLTKEEIPTQFKPVNPPDFGGQFSAAGANPASEDDGVGAVHEEARNLEQRLLNLGRKDGNEGSPTINGYRGLNLSHGRESPDQKKAKEKKDSDMRFALKTAQAALEARLAEIDELILQNQDKIRKFENEANELKGARERLEAGESLEDVLEDPATLKRIEEYKKRTGKDVDLTNRDAVLQVLILEEQYRRDEAERLRKENEELHREREDLRRGNERIEEAKLKGDITFEEAEAQRKELLEAARSEAVHAAWRDDNVSQELKESAAVVHTENHKQEHSSLSSFASSLDGLAEGINAEFGSIKHEFSKASDPNSTSPAQMAATSMPTFDSPKI